MDQNQQHEEHKHEEHKGDEHKKNTAMAIVAYILFFVPLLTDAKNDPFVKYHVKQGLLLFIGWVVAYVIVIVPVIGWVLAPILSIALIILFIIGVVNAANGKEVPLPIIGHLASNFNF